MPLSGSVLKAPSYFRGMRKVAGRNMLHFSNLFVSVGRSCFKVNLSTYMLLQKNCGSYRQVCLRGMPLDMLRFWNLTRGGTASLKIESRALSPHP